MQTPVYQTMESPSTRTQIDVWIVEDHSDFRHTIAYVLDSEPNMSCSKAFNDYESVMELIANKEGWTAPGVVLMDHGLPGMNGIEGIRHFKQRLPIVPIIMLTIQDDDELIYEALRAGASGYLTKNSSLNKIIEAIQVGFNGGTLMPPGVARKVLKYFTDQGTPQADYGLTAREKEILNLMGQGKAHKKIAHDLFLSYHTVDSHVRNIYRKLHVSSGIEAVAKAYRERLI